MGKGRMMDQYKFELPEKHPTMVELDNQTKEMFENRKEGKVDHNDLSGIVGKKYDTGKPRWSLVPLGVMKLVIDVLEIGAAKYGEENWKHVENGRTRYYDAAKRHIEDWWEGLQEDKDDGHHPLAHAICCLMFLLWKDKNNG